MIGITDYGQCSGIGLPGAHDTGSVIDLFEQASFRAEVQVDILAY
jgi:hypothetical protein